MGTVVRAVRGDELGPSGPPATVCKHGKEGAVTCTLSHGLPWARCFLTVAEASRRPPDSPATHKVTLETSVLLFYSLGEQSFT